MSRCSVTNWFAAMHRFVWRLRYASTLISVGGLDLSSAWQCSVEAFKDFGEDDDPVDCAFEEMSVWSE